MLPVATVRTAEDRIASTTAGLQYTTSNSWLQIQEVLDNAGEYLVTSPGKYPTGRPNEYTASLFAFFVTIIKSNVL